MSCNVVAVVVTFNRKNLLNNCLTSLLSQSLQPSRIIVIDNASTDGTCAYLEEEGYLANKKITYIRLEKNIGGAGGFNKGVELSLKFNPNWVWVMDDDGKPSENCLEELLNNNGDVRAPLVLDIEDPRQSSFPYLADDEVTTTVNTLANAKEIRPVHPFNGVLISTNTIKKIGLPNPDFFIWGDEIDYRHRWLDAGFTEKVNNKAIFFHPADRQVMQRSNKRSFGVPMGTTSKLRKYCFYRNQVFIYKKHKGWFKCLGKIFFSLTDIMAHETDKNLFVKAALHGLRSKFGKEQMYIKP